MDTKNVLLTLGALVVGVTLGMHGFTPKVTIDQVFIEQMVPHHEGAIELAQAVLAKTQRPEIASLAQGIIEAQQGEVDMMHAKYDEWFHAHLEDATPNDGHMHMEGMEGDMARLLASPDLDREFLEQMIIHHEMAVMMAQLLHTGSKRQIMKDLAAEIITSQSDEILLMRGWLESWY